LNEVEVVLAASARDWPDRIHRFLTDHGGARVRGQVLTPEDALLEDFQVLVIDDICSFLTPHLVSELQRRGKLVLGVFDPVDSPDAKERLRECGVDQVLEADATGDEFVIALRALVVLAPDSQVAVQKEVVVASARTIAVGAPPGGCGATEVAIAIASELARYGTAVLVDLDEVAPSVAQRLGLPMLPNLRTAIDAVTHNITPLEASLLHSEGLAVLAGLSNDRDWMDVRTFEVSAVIEQLQHRSHSVVINVGSQLGEVGFGDGGRFALSRLGVSVADWLVAVGLPQPVGITRLTAWTHAAASLNPDARQTLIVNRAPRSPFRRAEIAEELSAATGQRDIRFIGDDPQLRSATWNGQRVRTGRLRRACRSWARDALREEAAV
jgi:MinD-like ATPase involved in chromosome partitioning or flagellar assembly